MDDILVVVVVVVVFIIFFLSFLPFFLGAVVHGISAEYY